MGYYSTVDITIRIQDLVDWFYHLLFFTYFVFNNQFKKNKKKEEERFTKRSSSLKIYLPSLFFTEWNSVLSSLFPWASVPHTFKHAPFLRANPYLVFTVSGSLYFIHCLFTNTRNFIGRLSSILDFLHVCFWKRSRFFSL